MDIEKVKILSFDEIRSLYKAYLQKQNISKATIILPMLTPFIFGGETARNYSGMQSLPRISTMRQRQRCLRC